MILTIEAATANELCSQLREIVKSFGIEVDSNQLPLPLAIVPNAATAPTASTSLDAVESAETQKRKRRTKAEMEADAVAKAASPVVTSIVNPTPPTPSTPLTTAVVTELTIDQVRAALGQVNDVKGTPAARELLTKFSCARISDLKKEKYTTFVEECRAAVTTSSVSSVSSVAQAAQGA